MRRGVFAPLTRRVASGDVRSPCLLEHLREARRRQEPRHGLGHVHVGLVHRGLLEGARKAAEHPRDLGAGVAVELHVRLPVRRRDLH